MLQHIKLYSYLLAILLLPAHTVRAQDIPTLLDSASNFFGSIVVPLIFAVAILFFFINVTRYFIIEGGDASSRGEARKYMVYSLAGIVILASLWGIINLIASSLTIDGGSAITPDYTE